MKKRVTLYLEITQITAIDAATSKGEGMNMAFSRYGLVMSAIIAISALMLGGCGAPQVNKTDLSNTAAQQSINTAGNPNPPFQNKLNVGKVTPSSQFDAKRVDEGTYGVFSVTNLSGNSETLYPKKTPVLFEAYWCPHCQRTLVMMNKNWNQLKLKPTIVATGFQPGTTLAQAKSLVTSEEEGLQLNYAKPTYYLLSSDEQHKLIQSYPEFIFGRSGEIYMLQGEHTLEIWEQALS